MEENVDKFDLREAKKLKDEANNIIKANGNVDEALDLYKKAIDLCPPYETSEKAIFHNNMGLTLKKIKKIPEAKIEFEKSMELNPNYVKPLYNRMLILKDQKQYDEAFEDTQKILSIDPSFQR